MSWKTRRSLKRIAPVRRTLIDGVDVTQFRRLRRSHKPFTHQGYDLVEPFAYGTASLLVPRYHANELDNGEGVGDAAWMRKEAPVAYQRVYPDGTIKTDYLGFISQINPEASGRVRLAIRGELSGRLDAIWRPQPVFRRLRDCGDWVYSLLVGDANQRMSPILGPVTGIRLPNKGQMSGLAWASLLCSMSQTNEGGQRTIMPATWGTRDWRFDFKDYTTVHGTFMADGKVVKLDVADDLFERPNTWWGEGVQPDGGHWRNAKAPGITGGDPPAYPNTDDAPFGEGTTNADTDSGSGVSVLHARLIGTGAMDHLDSPDSTVYTAAVAAAVEEAQRQLGMAVTGIVTRAFWDRLFDIEKAGYSLAYAGQRPLVQADRVKRWHETPEGYFADLNEAFDPRAVRVDRPLNFGPATYKHEGVRWARGAHHRSQTLKNWVGTVSLESRHGVLIGGWDGTEPVPPTEVSIMAIEDIRPGMNLQEPFFDGGTLFHVAGVRVGPDGKTGTLTVDTQARDLLEVEQIRARNMESRRDPRREWIAENRPNSHSGNLISWDAEIGGRIWYDRTLRADRWTIVEVPVGQAGQINRIRLRTTGDPAAFSVAVFRVPVTHKQLMRRIGNPLTPLGDDDLRWYEDEAKLGDWWEERKLLYHAGDAEQPCGYWPRKHTNESGLTTSHTITGMWEDIASWSYLGAEEEPSILYMAIFADRASTLEAGLLFYKQVEDGI
ncbi:MAG TPA: peptidoglycan-binding protein [Aeromicrobium sp.]|nr:peptidoglycan-binding protein [Aeromicrobium sp.]HKY58315.1 peptidoglycan-binding protein [Aeromicrobium sp.]